MKKLLAFILVFTLVLGLGAVASASPDGNGEPETHTDVGTVSINKIFKLKNDGTTSPAETFNFTIAKIGVTNSQYNEDNMPVPTFVDNSVSFDQGDANISGNGKAATLTLPTYEHVGIFTYKITETGSNTAGIDYDATEIYLKVTVIQQGDKKVRIPVLRYGSEAGKKMGDNDGFNNTFKAGNLAITKDVTGNMGEKDRYFKVTVNLTTPADKNVKDTVAVTGGSDTRNPNSVTVGVSADFYLKDGETITLGNIPYGVTYTVAEEDVSGDGYTTTYTNEEGTISLASVTAGITNHKEIGVDTGINLDSLPYLIILAVAIAGLAIFIVRRRMAVNE